MKCTYPDCSCQVRCNTDDSDDAGSFSWRDSLFLIVICTALAVVIASTVVLAVDLPIRHWIAVHLGVESAGPDKYYNFWSGSGSDFGEIALVGGMITGVTVVTRHVNCHNKGCWRIGVHRTKNGHHLCRKCIQKPDSELTLHEVHEDHR